MAKKGTIAGVPLSALIIFIIGIIVVLYILKNKNLFRFGTAIAGAAVGATVPGPNVYPSLGDLPRNGDFGWNIANSGTSFRDNVSFPCTECARETTWFFVPGSSSGVGFFKPVKFGQQ